MKPEVQPKSRDTSAPSSPSAVQCSDAFWALLIRVCALGLLSAALAACSLPTRPPAPQLFDFGPSLGTLPAPSMQATGERPLLGLRVQASPALETPAMLYRLAYADAMQPRAYSQSRWAMTPADLLQQRLRDGLSPHYLLLPGDGAKRVLHVELQEFSHLFNTPQDSSGLLRLRASVLQRAAAGEQVLAQRDWQFQLAAPSPDAAGGARALQASTAQAVQELAQWLQQVR